MGASFYFFPMELQVSVSELKPVDVMDHPFSTYAKFSEKTNISCRLIRTRTCAYQGVRNVSFSENFAFVLNKWSLMSLLEVMWILTQTINKATVYKKNLEMENRIISNVWMTGLLALIKANVGVAVLFILNDILE